MTEIELDALSNVTQYENCPDCKNKIEVVHKGKMRTHCPFCLTPLNIHFNHPEFLTKITIT